MPHNNSKNYPLVSVVCICFNHAEYVTKALASVLEQNYPNIELILVDDFSQDHSRNAIDSWSEKSKLKAIIFNEENLGVTKSFNKALKLVEGTYVIDLAADDMLAPTAIENHIQNFKKNHYKVGVSFGNVETIDENGTHLKYQYKIDENRKALHPPAQGFVYENVLERHFISSPSMMSHIEVYEKLEGYDQELIFEDFDFLVRASRIYPFFYCDEILTIKRTLSNSLGKAIPKRNKIAIQYRKAFIKIYRKAINLNETKSENMALIHRMLRDLKLCLRQRYYHYFVLTGFLISWCFIKHPFYKS